MKLPFNVDLKDKVVVVTGAAGVLCSFFCEAIAECGAKVALLDRDIENAEKFAKKINDEGKTAKAYKIDVLDKTSIEAAREQIHDDFGTCDILVNGAGGNNPRATTTQEYYSENDTSSEVKTFFDLDRSGIELVFDLNILGTLLPTQVFAKDMIGKEDVSIINISSMNAFTPLTKIPAYSAAKAGVSNLTQWLAVHFSKVGIRVNAMAPGFLVTNQNRNMLFDAQGNPTARTAKILAGTPMERFAEPQELLGTLLFLLSKPASGFITGAIIPIDGGFSAYSGV